jgi:glycosyltransferase involved in cell wall biosynthesis
MCGHGTLRAFHGGDPERMRAHSSPAISCARENSDPSPSGRPLRLVILSPDYPPKQGGLADHTQHLATFLHRLGGCDVWVITTRGPEDSIAASEEEAHPPSPGISVRRVLTRWGWRDMALLAQEIARASPDWVLVQYVPHAYDRRGVNLAFPIALLRERLAGRRLLLLAHELYVDFPDVRFSLTFLKRVAAAVIQRAMFWLAAHAARALAVSIEPWAMSLRHTRFLKRVPVFHLPSPSNIERVPTDRKRVRQQLGIRETEIVLAFFGMPHVSKKGAWLLRSVESLLDRGMAARLLLIGPGWDALCALAPDRVRERILVTGYVDAATVSHYLHASDIFLLPTHDGVSTRRSSLMAALSHGLPVVGTSGRLTDALLHRSGALLLSPADDLEAFLEHVITVAEDAERRRQLAERGLALYREHFCWPVVIERLLAALRNSG